MLNILQQSDTDFFLTGGTALSRAYYNHRYSDDLDFFVNNSETFDDQLDAVLSLLRKNGFCWSTENDYTRTEGFTTLKVGKNSDVLLKLDFVNDSVPHYGEFVKTNLFYRTDSKLNILSNKLSAIFRYAAKDVADIREIAINEKIDWVQAIKDARQKEAGLELIYVSEILTGIPKKEFESIAWVKKPDWKKFHSDIEQIVFQMING